MTTEREEALELAREAGFDELQGWRDNNEIDYYFEGWPEHVEKLVRLAKQRGAEEEREACAKLCETLSINGVKADQTGWCAEMIMGRSHK